MQKIRIEVSLKNITKESKEIAKGIIELLKLWEMRLLVDNHEGKEEIERERERKRGK